MSQTRLTHDPVYKKLFSDPEMVKSLLEEFVPDAFVQELDYSTLNRCSGNYVTDDLRERHSDIVWRVGWKNGTYCYIVILLEFQSRTDHWMALRMLAYTALLLQDLVKTEQISSEHTLPAVFPIVLYNGLRPWSAPRDMFTLYGPMPESVRQYCPRQRYLLIDENRITEAQLAQSIGLSGYLFKLERSKNIDVTRQLIKEIILRFNKIRGIPHA